MVAGVGAPNPSGIPNFNTQFGLQANSTGVTNATQIPAWVNEFSTNTTNGAAQLPPASAGLGIYVVNDGANSMTVYGAAVGGSYDTVNLHTSTSGVTTGVAQASGTVALYLCYEGQGGNTNAPIAGAWKQLLTG